MDKVAPRAFFAAMRIRRRVRHNQLPNKTFD
jgi:hypothetical protein